jgi:predicted aldo/keto reductase-like oxidoreductase
MSRKNDISRRQFLTHTAALSSLPIIAGCTGDGKSPLSSNIRSLDPIAPAGKSKAGVMPMRTLGKTGLSVSVLTHGCAPTWVGLGAATMKQTIDTALAGGINVFDFASEYGTEPLCSTYLPPSIRSTINITTKLNSRDYNGAKTEFENSLKVMKLDYVDILFCHNIDTSVNIANLKAGAWKYLVEAKAAGKTKFIGFSSMASSATSKQFLQTTGMDPDVCMFAISAGLKGTPNDPSGYIKDCLPIANSANIGVFSMKAIKGMTGVATAKELLAYVLNLKDSSNNPSVASITFGPGGGPNEVQQNIDLVKQILGSSGVVDEALYDFKDLERRAAKVNNPESMCWMRHDYRDGGEEYVWA